MIRFVLERFYYGWKMNAMVFDRHDQIVDFCLGTIERVGGDNEEARGILSDAVKSRLFSTLKLKAQKAGIPVIHMEGDGIYYISFMDGEERLFLLGPASTETLSFGRQMAYRKRHHVANQKYQVPKVTFARSLNGVALAYYALTGRQVTEEAIMKASGVDGAEDENASEMLTYEIQNMIGEKQHLTYQEELKWLARIENGTLDEKEDRITPENLEKLEKIGVLANGDSLKQFEYMAVTSTVLAARAAIRGGVNAYEAYRLSEVYLQKIAKCTNVMELIQIHSVVAGEFSRQARLAREHRNYDCVEQCKDYVARHKNRKLSLNDLAEAVGKNPGYLSRTFSERTGMTLQQYTLGVRLEAAANMLIYSNEGVGEIAEYLNFSSASHFGERFKERYGVTPVNYRKQHKIRDF